MHFSGSGLTVWYGTPDAPAPPEGAPVAAPVEITIGVEPALSSNTVSVLYRENGGPERNIRATLSRTDHQARKHYFRAALPVFMPGTKVEYQPVLVSAGRRVNTPLPFPSSFYISQANPSAASLPGPDALRVGTLPFRYEMEHLTRVAVQLRKRPEVIGNTPDGLRLDFLVNGGFLRGEKINGVFYPSGGDWMRVRTDGVGITDIIATIKTDDGALILMEASGIFDLGVNGFDQALAGHYPDTGPVVISPRFLSADLRYFWLNRLPCTGIGYVNMDALQVHYDVYGIHSQSTTTDGVQ